MEFVMIKSRFGLALVLAATLSTNAIAHGDHSAWTGKWFWAGMVLNGLEFGKHALVVVDQLTDEKEEKDSLDNVVLAGNAVIGAGHVYLAVEHFLQARLHVGHAHEHHKHTLPLLAAANLFSLADAVVDGITTWDYWTHEPSWSKTAVMLVTPLCLVSNIHLMVTKVTKAFRPKHA